MNDSSAELVPDLVALPSSAARHTQEKIEQTLTVNRLRFDRVGLCGRAEELAILKKSFARLVEASSNDGRQKAKQRELFLLSGHSGVGKSALASHLKGLTTAANGLFCSGGIYDVNQRDEPFLGIATACKDLCQQILRLEDSAPERFRQVRDGLRKGMGAELVQLMAKVVVELKEILQLQDSLPEVAGSDGQKKEKIAASFRVFFRIISSLFAPVVILLDDLQWSDPSSLEALKTIITDHNNSGLMIAGCYRSNEIDDEHLLSKMIRDLAAETQNDQSFFTLTELVVQNLSLGGIVDILSALLSKENHEVLPLAEVCRLRTDGNVFFVQTFLAMLVQEDYLKFQLGTFQWCWTIEEILEHTSASPNLLGLIHSRILSMSASTVEILKVAACLSHRFDGETLWMVLQELDVAPRCSHDDFENLLRECCENSILSVSNTNVRDSTSSTSSIDIHAGASFRFSHSKVQEAVVALIENHEEFVSLQHEIGKVLLENLSPEEQETMIFVLANLVNCGKEKGPDIALLNLQAATKAKDMAAFQSTLNFVEHGVKNISGDKMWTTHFDIVLKLHTLGAVAHSSLGNDKRAIEYCEEVLEQKHATPLQKCGVYNVQLDVLHCRQEHSLALEKCLAYLKELGCHFPSNKIVRKIQAAPYMSKTRKDYIPTIDQMEEMPHMSDAVTLQMVQLLERAGSSAFAIDEDLYIMTRCKFVRCIGDKGLTPDTGGAFASFANVLMHKYGDFDTAKELAELSIVAQDLMHADFYKARTLMTVHFFVLSWINPVQSRRKKLLEGYEVGMRVGNTFSGVNCSLGYVYLSFLGGTKLQMVHEDCCVYITQMRRLKIDVCAEIVSPIWQLVENLLGISGSTIILKGNVIDEDEILKSAKPHTQRMVHRFKCYACMLFGEYEAGADLILAHDGAEFLSKFFLGCGSGLEFFPMGVCMYASARLSKKSTKQKKYKRVADQVRSQVQELTKKGCMNLTSVLSLLDAEFYALSGKPVLAKKSYNQAVVEAARGGFQQNAAVASERYSGYLLELKEYDEASYRLNEAIKYYREWGAPVLVSLLEKRETALSEHK